MEQRGINGNKDVCMKSMKIFARNLLKLLNLRNIVRGIFDIKQIWVYCGIVFLGHPTLGYLKWVAAHLICVVGVGMVGAGCFMGGPLPALFNQDFGNHSI